MLSNKTWQRISFMTGWFTVGILFGLMVLSANIEIKDLDIWLHLKMGEFIVHHGYVPNVDILSATIAGQPWVNHEWLFQIISYLTFSQWGPDGLLTMQVLIVTLTFFILLFLGYNREKQLGVIFILLMVMLVYRTRFTIRPDIFSLLFFALYIHILALHINKRWALYAIFVVQVLWSNSHGFFFFGPLIILLALFSEFIKRNVKLPWDWNKSGRLTNPEYKRLKIILLVVVVASFVNPMTIRGAWYPFGVLLNISGESRVFFKHIQELRPPIPTLSAILSPEYLYYKLLIFVSLLTFFFNRRKIDIGDIFIWLVFLLFSLVAIRNLVYFAFAAYLVSMSNLASISFADIVPVGFSEKRFEHISSIFVKILLTFWMFQVGVDISNRGYFDFDKFEMKSEIGGVTLRSYPNKAADFLVENNIKGNFFNDFNSGAYLIGRCFPNIKVFIDGRTEMYGPKFFKYYQKLWKEGDKQLFREAIEKYNLTGALLNSVHVPAPAKTLNFFYDEEDWKIVYFDYDAVIYLKDTPENRPVIEKYEVDMKNWEAKEIDIRNLGARRVIPFLNVNRAYTLESLGFDVPAYAEAQAALKVSPGHVDPYKIIGKIYGKREQYQKAFEYFRIAAMIVPRDVENRLNLALAYNKLEDYANAIKQYQMVIRYEPKNPKGHFLLAKSYIQNHQYEEAMEAIIKANKLAPKASKELIQLGDLIYEADEYQTAKEVYSLALEIDEDSSQIHYKVGKCFQSLGHLELAEEEFEKSEELKKKKKLEKDEQEAEKENLLDEQLVR